MTKMERVHVGKLATRVYYLKQRFNNTGHTEQEPVKVYGT